MKAFPLVSVIIPNYNYERYLSQAIDSVLNQSYPNVEVIVVDDGSTDNSLKVIQGYGDRIVSVAKKNGGQASAFNAGYEKSQGEIICLLDADDLFLPNKADVIVDLFQKSPDIDWVFTESAPVTEAQFFANDIGSIFEGIMSQTYDYQLKQVNHRERIIKGDIGNFSPSTSNLCFSRRLAEKLFPLPEVKGLSGMAITDLYMKLPATGLGVGYVTKQNLGIFRLHDNFYSTLGLDKKRRMFGEIYTTTGYWMDINFPEFEKVNMKIITKGYATYLKSNYMLKEINNADCGLMFKEYLAKADLLKRTKASLMVIYYSLKLSFKNLV